MFKHVSTPPIPHIKDKTFPDGKRFYLTPDGNKYPSVTTVLGYKEKPWLEDWRNMLGKKKADKETKRCSARGTAIHEMVEKYLNNEQFERKNYDPSHYAGFNQLKIRLNKVDNIKAQEIALYSDTLRIAGRVDCIAEYKGSLSVIDFKTSNNVKDKSMIEDYFLQCTAYAIMWNELTGETIEDITILMSVEKGLMPLVFREKVDKYIEPLIKRVSDYYNGVK